MKKIGNIFKNKKFLIPFLSVIIFSCLISGFLFWVHSFKRLEKVKPLSSEEQTSLVSYLNTTFQSKRNESLRQLPYSTVKAELDVSAESAILVDAANGCILYEKNADELIPPASITKLFVMYIVFKEIEAGNLSLDDLVEPPENSWAINMPSDSSLMFLGQGHIVTVDELLKGLAVASGNDAALAIAYKISGNTKKFVERMNYEAKALGLENTNFVEPSGYSEKNVTTARELAEFCRIYINRFPESLSNYHSCKEILYPLQNNLPSWQKEKKDSMAIYQRNTNPLLGKMEGCDGLKTGFIYESGYNLALTAKRNGVRFLSVTLRGKGVGSKQGNFYRVQDGNAMMEWAFSSFADYYPEKNIEDSYTIPVLGAKEKFIKLVPAWTTPLTVPHIEKETAVECASSVKAEISIPEYAFGEIQLGKEYGHIQYKIGDTVLETVPLVADRNVKKSSLFGNILGHLASYAF